MTGGIPTGVDCSAGVLWATGPAATWADWEADAVPGRANNALGWALVAFPAWVTGVPDQAGPSLRTEFPFAGPGTSATIHVHDQVAPLHEEVTFVVTGGPAGARWVCKHICSVPDNGIFVSIDPLDLSPNDHLDLMPAIPPVAGTIAVAFA